MSKMSCLNFNYSHDLLFSSLLSFFFLFCLSPLSVLCFVLQTNDSSLTGFLSKMDSSHWMENVRTLISTAVVVARILHREV